MGAVGGLLGTAGGQGGTGFQTPSGASAEQLNQSYAGNQQAMGQQQQLLDALKGQNGIQNQSQVYNQLQGVVSGQGPNPAQAMLNQSTGTNVANQAALMAGQRGASANSGLMARQAAQTGAGLQQQAAGQGASMQAQQSLGAMGQAGNMAGNMVANQMGQTNQNVNSQQNEQAILQGANSANNQVQGQLANTTMQGQQKLMGGIMNGAGGMMGLAEGGPVPLQNGPQSKFGKSLMGAPAMAEGGKVPALVSPGEKYLKPTEAKMVAGGKVSPQQVGEQIPGQAKVKGNSYKNDTVRKDLEPGGVVIPRSVMQSKNPEKGAAEFVRSVIAKKGKKA